MAKIFKDHFENIVESFHIERPCKVEPDREPVVNTIKKNYKIFSEFLFANLNDIILISLFPEQLKYADIKPVFKKDSPNDKRNYRPVLLLTL